MKPISQLSFGYADAENYRKRENKQLLNNVFVRTPDLDSLCRQDVYFVIGEKGTGKTACAFYISNNAYKDNFGSVKYIRETEYQKFLSMRENNNLQLSDFTNIWRVIILLLIAEQVYQQEKDRSIFNLGRFRNIKNAIDEYYSNAFSPEIIYAMQFVEESKRAAELIAKYAKVGAEEKNAVTFTTQRFQTNLLYIQRNLEDALRSLKLTRNYVLFIDGIDIRPGAIPYLDYLACVKGLANAVWSVNNDFFADIKDSRGRLRVVLLVRPDIFDALGLQNQNSKITDNSVVLDWRTTYTEYRTSPLFLVTDRLLKGHEEKELREGESFDYYFPFNSNKITSSQERPSAFITLLRHSLYRPRDILTMLRILRENHVEARRDNELHFKLSDFYDPAFTRKYSDYMLGEVKDHLSFYYSASDYEMFVKFFQYLNGRSRFTYDEYLKAYQGFVDFMERNMISPPGFCTSADGFLQFLYELNVIGYVVQTDDNPFFGWCFRERTQSNIAPKVRTHVRYDINYGLMKALDLGRRFAQP